MDQESKPVPIATHNFKNKEDSLTFMRDLCQVSNDYDRHVLVEVQLQLSLSCQPACALRHLSLPQDRVVLLLRPL